MNELEDLFANPVEEDLRIVRTRTLATIQLQSRGIRHPWLWWGLAASIVAALFVSPFAPQQTRSSVARQAAHYVHLQPATLPEAKLPERQLQPALHHPLPKQLKKTAGLQTAERITTPDGNAQMRLQTGDPKVVILLQINTGSQEN